MSFYNAGAWEIEIDGGPVRSASDAEGAPVGEFASMAEALGAQREVNIKKLLLKKLPAENGAVGAYGCQMVFENDTSANLFAELLDGNWSVSEGPFEDILDIRQIPTSKPF